MQVKVGIIGKVENGNFMAVIKKIRNHPPAFHLKKISKKQGFVCENNFGAYLELILKMEKTA